MKIKNNEDVSVQTISGSARKRQVIVTHAGDEPSNAWMRTDVKRKHETRHLVRKGEHWQDVLGNVYSE